jgi:hypothetical protein
MNKYNLTIVHPGMSRYSDYVFADKFETKDGVYMFYVKIDPDRNIYESGEQIYRLKSVYPINITIIEKIELI